MLARTTNSVYDLCDRHGWTTWDRVSTQRKEEQHEKDKIEAAMAENRLFLKEAFAKFDADGNGTIDAKELRTMLRGEMCIPMSESDINKMLKAMDIDGDGVVQFEELLRWYSLE